MKMGIIFGFCVYFYSKRRNESRNVQVSEVHLSDSESWCFTQDTTSTILLPSPVNVVEDWFTDVVYMMTKDGHSGDVFYLETRVKTLVPQSREVSGLFSYGP